MVGVLLIVGSLFIHQIEAVTMKRYGDKNGKGGMFFNAFLCLAGVIYFLISDKGGLDFYKGIWIYAIINSFVFATSFYSTYIALKEGPFGITRLIVSFTGVVSVFYGVIVLNETISLLKGISIAIIFISVFLMRYQKQEEGKKKKFSVKWIIAMIFSYGSNATIGILGKVQQVKFNNIYLNEYLIITFLGGALWLFILGIICERDSFKPTVKMGLSYGLVAGFCNGMATWMALVANGYMNISILSPLKSGLGMVITFLVSLLFYKEKFTLRQYIGVFIGVVALILMRL